MGSPVTTMLAQAAPAQATAPSQPALPTKPVSEMTNEELAAYRRSLGLPEPSATPTPAPAAAAPQQSQGILDMLLGALSSLLPSTKSMAPQATPPPPPPTAEGVAQRNRAVSGQ